MARVIAQGWGIFRVLWNTSSRTPSFGRDSGESRSPDDGASLAQQGDVSTEPGFSVELPLSFEDAVTRVRAGTWYGSPRRSPVVTLSTDRSGWGRRGS
jgi:hypothetical protein